MVDLKRKSSVACQRNVTRQPGTSAALAARYDRRLGRVVVELSSGLSIAFRPQDVQGLEQGRPAQLSRIEISPSGMGLHFPDLDADLYLPALLQGFLGSRRWMAAQMGKAGGRKISRAKTAAAQTNGKLGGRPKKPRAGAVA